MGYNTATNNMRKLMYSLSVVFVLIGMTTMTSCKPEKKIIGTWKVTYSKGMNDDLLKGTLWTFKDNGKFLGDIWGGEEEISWNYGFYKKALTLYIDCIYYDYSRDRYRLNLDVDNLSKKEMSLSGTVVDIYYDKDGNFVNIDSWNVRYELEKK